MIRGDLRGDAPTHGANKARRCCILTQCASGFVSKNVADLILYNTRSGKGAPQSGPEQFPDTLLLVLLRYHVASSIILQSVRPYDAFVFTVRHSLVDRPW